MSFEKKVKKLAQKVNDTNYSYPNEFWGEEMAPPEVVYTLRLPTFNRSQMRQMVARVSLDGSYYDHSLEERWIELAFENKKVMEATAAHLKLQAKLNGRDVS